MVSTRFVLVITFWSYQCLPDLLITAPTSNCYLAQPPPWPFQNMSTYLLKEWMITGNNQKSGGKVDHLVNDVLLVDEYELMTLLDLMLTAQTRNLMTLRKLEQETLTWAMVGTRHMSTLTFL